jgi:hypothetical protein
MAGGWRFGTRRGAAASRRARPPAGLWRGRWFPSKRSVDTSALIAAWTHLLQPVREKGLEFLRETRSFTLTPALSPEERENHRQQFRGRYQWNQRERSGNNGKINDLQRFISAVEGVGLIIDLRMGEKGYFPASAREWFSAMNPMKPSTTGMR